MARRTASALALSLVFACAHQRAHAQASKPPPPAPAKAPAPPAATPKAPPALAPAPATPKAPATPPAALAPKAPAAPAAPAAPKAPPPVAAPGAAPSQPPLGTVERARQGVVVLERAGRPLGLGVILDGDGRILTALSALTHGNYVSARYHDGSVSPIKLVHSDRGWDLALLAPDKLEKKSGVRAAKLGGFENAQVLTLSAWPNTVSTAPASLKLGKPLLGGDGRALPEAYELGFRAKDLGAPVLNTSGEVVALVARACPAASGAGCLPAPYGVPVSAIKQFLRKVPAQATWLGIQAAADDAGAIHGLRVVSISAGSPAAGAGLRAGKDAESADLIVAVDGAPVLTPAELNEAVRAHVVGDEVQLLVYGMGRYRQVALRPKPAPELAPAPYVPPKAVKPLPRAPNPYR